MLQKFATKWVTEIRYQNLLPNMLTKQIEDWGWIIWFLTLGTLVALVWVPGIFLISFLEPD